MNGHARPLNGTMQGSRQFSNHDLSGNEFIANGLADRMQERQTSSIHRSQCLSAMVKIQLALSLQYCRRIISIDGGTVVVGTA